MPRLPLELTEEDKLQVVNIDRLLAREPPSVEEIVEKWISSGWSDSTEAFGIFSRSMMVDIVVLKAATGWKARN